MKKKQLHYLVCLMLLVLFSCKKDAQKNLAVNTASGLKTQSLGGSSLRVSMGGNAFVTKLAPGGDEVVTSTTLANWTSPNSIFSAYFRLGNTGSLTLKVKAKVASGSSVIKLTVNGVPFNVPMTGSAFTTYNVGTVNVSCPGYVKVNFQGVSKTGDYYADISRPHHQRPRSCLQCAVC